VRHSSKKLTFISRKGPIQCPTHRKVASKTNFFPKPQPSSILERPGQKILRSRIAVQAVYRGCVGGAQEADYFALGCTRLIEEKLFKTTLPPPEEVAAIFVEPVQGESGYVVAPTIFMQEPRRICDRHGILLVADEVQSGIGRTGKWFAIEHTGVEPDMVCMAKAVASGMPLGVTMTRAEIMDWFLAAILAVWALQGESAHSRQPDIEDEATGHVWTLACQQLLRGPEQFDMQTHGADKALDCAPHRGIVIDNENDRLRGAH
jgi:hypothetical protein